MPRQKSRPTNRPPPRVVRRRAYQSREERREQIVAATLAILTDRGLHAWKTSELARQVGVSEPTLFRHFADKNEILAAAAQRATDLIRARIASVPPRPRGWVQVRLVALAVLRAVEDTGGAPVVVLAGQLSGTAPGIRRMIQDTMNVLRRRLITVIGAAEPKLRGSPKAHDLADLAIAVIQSSALRWIVSGKKYPMLAQADAMLRMFIPSTEAIETPLEATP